MKQIIQNLIALITGNLSSLTTTAKSDLVEAINELKFSIDNINIDGGNAGELPPDPVEPTTPYHLQINNVNEDDLSILLNLGLKTPINVDWGDEISSSSNSHTYQTGGIYNILFTNSVEYSSVKRIQIINNNITKVNLSSGFIDCKKVILPENKISSFSHVIVPTACNVLNLASNPIVEISGATDFVNKEFFKSLNLSNTNIVSNLSELFAHNLGKINLSNLSAQTTFTEGETALQINSLRARKSGVSNIFFPLYELDFTGCSYNLARINNLLSGLQTLNPSKYRLYIKQKPAVIPSDLALVETLRAQGYLIDCDQPNFNFTIAGNGVQIIVTSDSVFQLTVDWGGGASPIVSDGETNYTIQNTVNHTNLNVKITVNNPSLIKTVNVIPKGTLMNVGNIQYFPNLESLTIQPNQMLEFLPEETNLPASLVNLDLSNNYFLSFEVNRILKFLDTQTFNSPITINLTKAAINHRTAPYGEGLIAKTSLINKGNTIII